MVFGQEREEHSPSRGFDRRTTISKPILQDDGLYQVFGRTVHGQPRTGKDVSFEPDRAWQPGDLKTAEDQAAEILRAHDFPVDYVWPIPGAWTWSEGELYWANAPEEGGFLLFDDGREEDNLMSGVTRGDLGWPHTGRSQDPRAAERWPRFSAFGWALEVFDLQNMLRSAKALPPTRDDLDHIWRLGFSLGSYLAEHRIRTLHADLLERGQENLAKTQAGASATNIGAKKRANIRRDKVFSLASQASKTEGLPDGYTKWSNDALVALLRDKWPPAETAPKASTLRLDIAILLKEQRGRVLQELLKR